MKKPTKPRKHNVKNGRTGKLTGYRLHDARLGWSGNGSAIRTIKFPLSGDNANSVADNIITDYKTLFGTRSLSDYLATSNEQPTMLGFFALAIKLGAVFASKPDSLSASWLMLYPDAKTPIDKAFTLLSPKWQATLDKNMWFDFVNKDARPAKTTAKSAYDAVIKLAKDPGKLDPELLEYATNFSEYVDKVKNGDKTIKFDKYKEFGLKKSAFPDTPKYSFVINPNWPEVIGNTKSEIIAQGLDRVSLLNWQILFGIAGSSEGFNSFYGNFFADSNSSTINLKGVANQMSAICTYTPDQFNVVMRRLEILANYAKQLPPHPSATKKGWNNYRTYIGGQLKSWGSNYIAQKTKIHEQISGLLGKLPQTDSQHKKDLKTPKPELQDIIDLLESYGVPENFSVTEHDGIRTQAVTLLKMTENAHKAAGNLSYADIFTLQSFISTLRADLNLWWQARQAVLEANAKDKKYKPVYLSDEYKALTKDLYKLPLIPGESALLNFDKVSKFGAAFPVFAKQANNIVSQAASSLGNNTIDNIATEKLRIWAIKTNSETSKIIADDIATDLSVDSFYSLPEHAVYYKNPRSRDKRLKQVVGYAPTAQVGDIATKYFNIGIIWLADINNVITDFDKAIDMLELCKTTGSLIFAASNAIDVQVEPINTTQHDFLNLTVGGAESLPLPVANKFLQTLVFAEMRGYISLASKNVFIERSVISTSDDSDFRLLVNKQSIDKSNPNWVTKASFSLATTSANAKASVFTSKVSYIELKKPSGSDKFEYDENAKLFKGDDNQVLLDFGMTTRYQTQFLWWLLNKPKNKANYLGFMSPSMIAEKSVSLAWGKDAKPIAQPSAANRLYVALPFQILADKKDNYFAGSDNRVMGIDVGEKGMAYVIAERVKNGEGKYKISIVAKGFLRKAEHNKLAGEVKALRNRQIVGTFGGAYTYIAHLRESLISNYRAEIDNLAIKFKARLAFEGSISAFETGGKKISKIYASVKKSEVTSMLDADKAEVMHYWGKDSKSKIRTVGVSILAAGTSQTCSKCGYWYKYDINEKHAYNVELVGVSQTLGRVKLENSKYIFVYAKKSDKILPKSIIGKELNGYVYNFMRPPIDSEALTFVLSKTDQKLDIADFDQWKEQNANSAVYICPYENCLHLSDADIQAAQNIATRGFIKLDADRDEKKIVKKDTENYDEKLHKVYEVVKSSYELETVPIDPRYR